MFNSGDLSDFIYMGGVTYPGGDALGIKNGVFVRLNELIDSTARTTRRLSHHGVRRMKDSAWTMVPSILSITPRSKMGDQFRYDGSARYSRSVGA